VGQFLPSQKDQLPSNGASNGTVSRSIPAQGVRGEAETAPVVTVPILSLRPADSPRLNGEDKAHIARLAEVEEPLPPILVDRKTMRVIDGMHRLMAASSQGRECIDVVFFEGSEADAFLRAVRANISHGLPLSQADRRAAAERLIASHPHMSDRAIAHVAGLAAQTVASVRRSSADESARSAIRVGRDGRLRPVDTTESRRRAAELLRSQPNATLRKVARVCGLSPATVLDVRRRLDRGESPVPTKTTGPTRTTGPTKTTSPAKTTAPTKTTGPERKLQELSVIVERLLRDPSLRGNERGRGMLRLLQQHNAVGSRQLLDVAIALPPHCVTAVTQCARHYENMWHDFANALDERARIIDPPVRAR
jgi:ParB-like chromosome segregation protein Spo0J